MTCGNKGTDYEAACGSSWEVVLWARVGCSVTSMLVEVGIVAHTFNRSA